MSKGIYTGVGGAAHKVGKAYVGVGNVARKVKKGYIGVGGVARQFYSAEPDITYYGTATALSVARNKLAATTVGNYALFGGGYGSSFSNVVDAYSTSLMRSTPTALSVARNNFAATAVGNYALFGGGYLGGDVVGTMASNAVDAYNTSLVRSTPTVLSVARYSLAATVVGSYALFGGGNNYSNILSTVDAYNTALVRTTPTVLNTARYDLAATTVGNYALFGGGAKDNAPSSSNIVDAYNTSLVHSTPTVLSIVRHCLAATTIDNYALFGGGFAYVAWYNSARSAVVDAYNTSLVHSTPTALSTARQNLAAATVGSYALFGGGYGSSRLSVVDAYNTSLVRSTPTSLSLARDILAATTVNNYALFGGGFDGSNNMSTVDAYTVA